MTTEVCDKNGLPIQHGDLLRTFHFRPAKRRLPIQYLYHVAIAAKNGLMAVPLREAIGGVPDGGKFLIHESTVGQSEIIDGMSNRDEKGGLVMWCERQRKAKK